MYKQLVLSESISENQLPMHFDHSYTWVFSEERECALNVPAGQCRVESG